MQYKGVLCGRVPGATTHPYVVPFSHAGHDGKARVTLQRTHEWILGGQAKWTAEPVLPPHTSAPHAGRMECHTCRRFNTVAVLSRATASALPLI
jgi:hypothetical protein